LLSWDNPTWTTDTKGNFSLGGRDKIFSIGNGSRWYDRYCPNCRVQPEKVGEYTRNSVDRTEYNIFTKKHNINYDLYREERHWYGYPAQILWIPSIALDIVTSPIQLFFFLHQFTDIKG
jgi:hypothetical protein